jgi:hypothetical protein
LLFFETGIEAVSVSSKGRDEMERLDIVNKKGRNLGKCKVAVGL